MTKEFAGRVVLEPIGKGSKSEHDAVLLVAAGTKYILRREGGNAFRDDVLLGLVGKRIRARGEVVGATLLMSAWDVD
jgi:hypothetical protein